MCVCACVYSCVCACVRVTNVHTHTHVHIYVEVGQPRYWGGIYNTLRVCARAREGLGFRVSGIKFRVKSLVLTRTESAASVVKALV